MPIKNTRDVCVLLLSDIRAFAVRETAIYQEMMQFVQEPSVNATLDARIFLSQKTLQTLNECFRILGQEPLKTSSRLPEVFMEDFRKELEEIQTAVARHLYILAKAQQLVHLRTGEYLALAAAADLTGNHAIGVLVESCLADNLAFGERTHHFIRHFVENKVPVKSAA